jgi:hypothetical protein
MLSKFLSLERRNTLYFRLSLIWFVGIAAGCIYLLLN